MTVAYWNRWWVGVLLVLCGWPGTLQADEPDLAREQRLHQVFEAAFGPTEGLRHYEQWRQSNNVPLEDYLTHPLLLASADATPAPTLPPDDPAPPVHGSANDYFLTSGDVLRISVWQWPSTSPA